MHQILWEDACGDDHVTKSRNRKLIRVSVWRHQINVRSISASTSVTITDIWTKFGTEHKYHTINTLEWPNSHKLKIQDGGGRYLEFRKNVNNSRLDKDICTKFYGMMHHGHAEMTTWPKVEIGSQFAWRHQINVWSISALISVTITDIWTKFGTEHKYHTVNTPEWSIHRIVKSKMAAVAILNFGKMSTPDWIKISAPNIMGRCITAMLKWWHDQKWKPEVNLRDVIKLMSEASASIRGVARGQKVGV